MADFVVDFPLLLFNPLILERKGNSIPKSQLPSRWVLNGMSACLIADNLKKEDAETFLAANRSYFLYREPSPFQVPQENNGLAELVKPAGRFFHDNPKDLWTHMPLKFDLHKSSWKKASVPAGVYNQARFAARSERGTPQPSIPDTIA